MSRPIIGITIGDPAGIGPEVATAALASGTLDRRCEYSLIGNHSKGRPGAPGTASATAALDALEEAAARAIAGELAAVVTGPVSKARMHEIGFLFPGQTEFFAARCGVSDFAMLLTGGGLTVALVTAHIPLSAVPGALRSSEIIRVGNLLTRHLQQRNVPRPRIAVAGLNPHAGEEGALGNEESAVIRPAVERLRMEWSAQVLFDGPISPDTVFYRATRGEFDAVLCMYHDQGLIPLKLHAFEEGVNVTLGLPFPRTSPDHGTAFEIAGKGIARPGSMIAAIQLAAVLVAGVPASTRLG